MKTSKVIGCIVAAHCVAVGTIFLMQGCGTTRSAQKAGPTEMPPTGMEAPINEQPVFQPAVPIEPVAKVPETKSYTVQSGDSLSLIAKRFNVSVRDIKEMNGLKSDVIRVGKTLKLPAYVSMTAAKPAAKPHKAVAGAKKPAGAAHAAVAGAGEYLVKSGDSLGKIAHAHGTTVKALREANHLTGDKLKVGQKLVLPGAAAAAPAEVAPGATAPAGEPAVPQPETAAPMAAPAAGVAPATGPEVGEGGAVVHVVGPNEELNEIAMLYGVSMDELMKQNGLTNNTLKVGQSLKIPSTSR